ncbi:hypothetical protein BHE74_00040398 [Ensete ventricosum]|nr:hypothetical protein GW17_00045904 [Ensete ventricosum]RWW53135.1 hypothetical protein BHE74_00040398 [Ensete ventricosum]RZR77568.1 hypothetical protein BHM03_00002680 [Ensete ventricosum]
MGEWRLLRKRGIGLGAAATTRGAAIKGEMEVEGSTERAKQPSSLRDGTAIVEPVISLFSSAKRTHRCETTKNGDPQRFHVRRESVWDMSWGHDVYSTSIAETRRASTVQLTPKTMS